MNTLSLNNNFETLLKTVDFLETEDIDSVDLSEVAIRLQRKSVKPEENVAKHMGDDAASTLNNYTQCNHQNSITMKKITRNKQSCDHINKTPPSKITPILESSQMKPILTILIAKSIEWS